MGCKHGVPILPVTDVTLVNLHLFRPCTLHTESQADQTSSCDVAVQRTWITRSGIILSREQTSGNCSGLRVLPFIRLTREVAQSYVALKHLTKCTRMHRLTHPAPAPALCLVQIPALCLVPNTALCLVQSNGRALCLLEMAERRDVI